MLVIDIFPPKIVELLGHFLNSLLIAIRFSWNLTIKLGAHGHFVLFDIPSHVFKFSISVTVLVVETNVFFTLLSMFLVQGLDLQRKMRYSTLDISQLIPQVLVFSRNCFMVHRSPWQFDFVVRNRWFELTDLSF